MIDRREAGRRARIALQKAKDAGPMEVTFTSPSRGPRQMTLKRSGQSRNLYFGYYLAYREMATGKSPFVDGEA